MINLRKISDIRDLTIPNVGYSCLFFNEKDEIKICVRLTEEEYKIYDVDPNLIEEKDYLRPIDEIINSMVEIKENDHYPKYYRVFSKDDFSIYERMSIERNGEYFYYWNQHYVGNINGRCQYNKIFGSWLLLLEGSWSIINEDISHIIRTDNPHKVTKEQIGLGAVINAIQLNKSDYDDHAEDYNNPHHVTKLDIEELKNIDNIDHASEEEFLKHNKDKFAHKLTKEQIDLDNVKNIVHASEEDLDNHAEDDNNPHHVTKITVGLSNVINEKQTTTEEFNNHLLSSDNPHHVSKSDIGLDKVLNIRQASKLSFNNHIGKIFNIHIVTLADIGLNKVTNEKQAVPENLTEHLRIKLGFTNSSVDTDKLDHGFTKNSIGLDNVKNIVHASEDAYNNHMFFVASDGTITTNKNADHKVTVNQVKLEKLIDSKTGQSIESIVDYRKFEEHLLTNNPHEVIVSESQLSELLNIENEKHLSKEEFEEHLNDDKAHQISSYNVGLGNVINMEQLTYPDFKAHITKKGRAAAEMHRVTKATLGMSSADNTSDIDKPLSRLQSDAISDNSCPKEMTDQISSLLNSSIESGGFISGIFHDYDNHGSLNYVGDFDGEKILSNKQFLNLKTIPEICINKNNIKFTVVSKNNFGKYDLATGWYFIYTGDDSLEYEGYFYKKGDYIVYNHEDNKFYITKNSKFIERNDASNIIIQKKNITNSTTREYEKKDFLNLDPITLGYDISDKKNAFDMFSSLWTFKYNGTFNSKSNLYLSPYQYFIPSRHISSKYNGLFSQDVVQRYGSIRNEMKINSTRTEKQEKLKLDFSYNSYYNGLFGGQLSYSEPEYENEGLKINQNPYKIKSFSNGKHICYSDTDTVGVVFNEKNNKVTSIDISPFSLMKDIITHDGNSEMYQNYELINGLIVPPSSFSSYFVGIPKKGFGNLLFFEPSEPNKKQKFHYSDNFCGNEIDGEIDYYWKTQIVKSYSVNTDPETQINISFDNYVNSCDIRNEVSKLLKVTNFVYFIIHKSKEKEVNGIYCINGINKIRKVISFDEGIRIRFIQRNASEIKKYVARSSSGKVTGIYINNVNYDENYENYENNYRFLAEHLNNTLTICTESLDGKIDSVYIFNEMSNKITKLNDYEDFGVTEFHESKDFRRYGSALKFKDFSDHLVSIFIYTLNEGRYGNYECSGSDAYSDENIICTCVVDKFGKRVTHRALREKTITNELPWNEYIKYADGIDDTYGNITTKVELINDNSSRKSAAELKKVHLFVNYEDISQTNQFVYGVSDCLSNFYGDNNEYVSRIGFNSFHYKTSCGNHSQMYNNVKGLFQRDCGSYTKAIGNNYYRNATVREIYSTRKTINNTYGSENGISSIYDENTSRKPNYFSTRSNIDPNVRTDPNTSRNKNPGSSNPEFFGSNIFNGQPYEIKGGNIIYEKGNVLDLVHPVLCYKIYNNATTHYPRFTETLKYCNGNFLTINRCQSDGKLTYWINTVIDGKPITLTFIPKMEEKGETKFSIDNIRMAEVNCSNRFDMESSSIIPSYNILIITNTGEVLIPESTVKQNEDKDYGFIHNNLTNFEPENHNRSCAFIKNLSFRDHHMILGGNNTAEACLLENTSDNSFGMKPLIGNIFNNYCAGSYTIPVVVDKMLSKGYKKKINTEDDILNVADIIMKLSKISNDDYPIGRLQGNVERCDHVVINKDITITITRANVYINDQQLNINVNGITESDNDAYNGTKIVNYLVVGNLLVLLNYNEYKDNSVSSAAKVKKRHSVCVVKLSDYFNFITSQEEMKSKIILTNTSRNFGFINEIKFEDPLVTTIGINGYNPNAGHYSMFLVDTDMRESKDKIDNSFVYSIGFSRDEIGHYFEVQIDNLGNIIERVEFNNFPYNSILDYASYTNFKPFNIGNITYYGAITSPSYTLIGCYRRNGENVPTMSDLNYIKNENFYENNEEIYDVLCKFFCLIHDGIRKPIAVKELRDGYLLMIPCNYNEETNRGLNPKGGLLYVPKRSIDQKFHQSRNYYDIDFNGQ